MTSKEDNDFDLYPEVELQLCDDDPSEKKNLFLFLFLLWIGLDFFVELLLEFVEEVDSCANKRTKVGRRVGSFSFIKDGKKEEVMLATRTPS